MAAKKQQSFEEGLEALEGMAQKLEASTLPLETLMKLYEESAALSKELAKKLDGMKAKLQEVRQGKDGKPEAAPSAVQSQESFQTLLGEEKSE